MAEKVSTKSTENASNESDKKTVNRSANANWQGGLQEGKGTLSTETGALEKMNYSYGSRFAEGKGTNPEELLAAAHAGCFTMSVAAMLGKKGLDPTSLFTKATVTLKGLEITGIHLEITGFVKGISADEFTAITENAAQNCIMSKAVSVPVTSSAHFTDH